ncbi:MAG: hypothetical protein IT379_16260, partial [Deltaproteobacteria bacterium]|nr:hypothetical protein [Deltaproteobacteria bacterium]
LQCVGSELTPRGAITLADYCTESPPPRHTMTEALEGFFSGRGAGELPISAECDSIPALTGPAPWELCAQLASRACPCVSASRCPLRSILGVDCLDATRDVVGCVLGRLPVEADDVCAVLDEIVRIRRECEG